jgi:hypothetical protein
MADTSLIIGNGNWAVKEDSLLGYNIIQGKYVPIEMNVVRTTTNTTATRVVNSAGLIELVPKNLFLQSQTFDNTVSWSPYPTTPSVASTVIPNVLVTSAPNGTFTADKLVALATTGEHILIGSPAGSNPGTTYTVSVFAKKGELSNIRFFDNAGSNATANFNLATGNVTLIANTTTTPTMVDVGNDWYRCIMTYTPNNTGTFNIHIKLANSSVIGGESFTGNGVDGVYLWGAQIELGLIVTEYFPTTDRFDIPRVDYSTGTASLLVEPARTNLVLQSQTLDNTSWSKVGESAGIVPVVTANQGTAPDGTMTADRVQFNCVGPLTGDRSRLTQGSLVTTIGTRYYLSIYVKAFSSGSVGFKLRIASDNLANSTIIITADWQRIVLTGLAGNASSNFIVETRGGATTPTNTTADVLLWGAQMEAGSNATSYIPTLAATGIRTADLISKTGISSLIGQTEGTIFVEANLSVNADERRIITISNGNEIQRIFIWTQFTTLYASFNNDSVNLGSFPIGTAKIAVGYTISGANTTYSIYVNDNPLITGTAAFAPSSLSAINLGSSATSGLQLNDRIESATLFPTRLINQQLQALTATIP